VENGGGGGVSGQIGRPSSSNGGKVKVKFA